MELLKRQDFHSDPITPSEAPPILIEDTIKVSPTPSPFSSKLKNPFEKDNMQGSKQSLSRSDISDRMNIKSQDFIQHVPADKKKKRSILV